MERSLTFDRLGWIEQDRNRGPDCSATSNCDGIPLPHPTRNLSYLQVLIQAIFKRISRVVQNETVPISSVMLVSEGVEAFQKGSKTSYLTPILPDSKLGKTDS